MNIYNKLLFKCSSLKLIAGVDEVGRGALIGPVIAAAVILDTSKYIFGLNDSKKISQKKRLKIYNNIINTAITWNIARVEAHEIDKLNIFNATMLAMQKAIIGLKIIPHCILIDGKYCPYTLVPSQAVIKGDSIFAEISAASILAKVHRDWEMMILHKKFPKYGLANNKGYPTKFHVKQLSIYGATIHHRCSFQPIKNIKII